MVRPRGTSHGGRLPIEIEITDEFLWFLGVWVAAGSWAESEKGGFISIASDEDVVRRAENGIPDSPCPDTLPVSHSSQKTT